MNSHDDCSCKWIGMAHVKPTPGNASLGSAIGAYVVAVGWAIDQRAFERLVTIALRAWEFEVLDIEDVEPYEERASEAMIDPLLMRLSEELTAKQPIAFGLFDAYLQE